MKIKYQTLFLVLLGVLLPLWGQEGKLRKKAAPKPAKDELVKNGGMEKGEGSQPAHWSPLDGITSTWDSQNGHPGKCIHFDTSVLQKDKKKFAENPENFKRGKGGQYDVVGAHEGAWAFAAPIDIPKGQRYFVLSCDVKGPSKGTELFNPMILIRGFQKVTEKNAGENSSWFHEHYKDGVGYSEQFGSDELRRNTREGDYLMVYRHSLVCRCLAPNTWEHFEMGIQLPTIPKFQPERLLLKLYAYWPAGQYYFDNVSFRPSTKEEIQEINSRRHSIKNFVNP